LFILYFPSDGTSAHTQSPGFPIQLQSESLEHDFKFVTLQTKGIDGVFVDGVGAVDVDGGDGIVGVGEGNTVGVKGDVGGDLTTGVETEESELEESVMPSIFFKGVY
jgi:hypothetical protein